MSRSSSANLFLSPGSSAIHGKFYLCCLYHSNHFCGLQFVQIWSINYVLRFGSVKIHKHCLYWSVNSTNINRKIVFNCLLLFKLLLLVSKFWVECVNSIIFFWHAQTLRPDVYLRTFSIAIYRKFSYNFPVLF